MSNVVDSTAASPDLPRFQLRLLPVLVCVTLAGCSTFDPILQGKQASPIPAPLLQMAEDQNGVQNGITATEVTGNPSDKPVRVTVSKTPKPPLDINSTALKTQQPVVANEKADITLVFDQIALPAFINAVYGVVLKTNFSVDPKVLERKDLVTLRTSRAQTPTEVLRAAQMLLKSYGVTVNDVGGFYRIVPDNAQLGYSPEIRRGRALPDVPMALRPIFQYVEMNALRSAEIRAWLAQMFGTRLQLTESAQNNALMISGETEDVRAALEVVRILDQPLMRGRTSQRISPTYWSVDDIAKKLAEVLAAEGYTVQVGMGQGGVSTPIVLIPIAANNALVMFSGDEAILKHMADWVTELDQPTKARGNNGYFTYAVLNLDADELAKTVQDLLGGGVVAASPSGATVKTAARVVVHKATNTLIIQGSADQYSQWIGLLRELDKPAKSALIEMTVAEVTLNDSLNLGIEWAINQGNTGNGTSGGTLGGLGLGTGGLTLNFVNGNIKAALNALATNDRAQILSSPRVMARNGETATISVGQQVPILTSQTSNLLTTGTAGTSTTQTIQYKDTGIILKVKPVIHAGGRIDVDVSQEVSGASVTTTGVSSSPTFSNRKVDTKLSIQDGATVMLGGLISESNDKGNAGIPFVKDIPLIGGLFRSQTGKNVKTELIVLITPYIIEDDQTAQSVTQAFRTQLGSWTTPANVPTPLLKPVRPQQLPFSSKNETLDSPKNNEKTSNINNISTPPEQQDPMSKPDQATSPNGQNNPQNQNDSINAAPSKGTVVTDPAIIEQIRALQKSNKK
ncbi:secretin N-terminal domain-containing protein [Undibacterium sp. RTI2.1]|uniref:secretin N-terminal domain-containing protein n=1 Tax=unclassified Undibacterium TaxID=2630295 RepID=UPI002B23AC7B|nr:MULTISPECIES: secretin N-terminal domain-containing protein [unclassified Undibacterium]MEB0032814.1 secretin N-terminal domain-containing protein [Undibacterium sp. RTI2.1]MEB0116468.1 secretin N-terminal domain-containing protein [Undibacterium sp. RTI2.2]